MSRRFLYTIKRLTPALKMGDLEVVERGVARQLRCLSRTPYHVALDLKISNDPKDAARHFDKFFKAESKRITLAAAYTEMNGFDINPDRWYCDLFGYSRDGGQDDIEWLSSEESKRFPEYQINGLERLQSVYANDPSAEYREARYMCSLLVVVKFQRLMEAAVRPMKELRFPLYVTAHDFDFIARFEPKSRLS